MVSVNRARSSSTFHNAIPVLRIKHFGICIVLFAILIFWTGGGMKPLSTTILDEEEENEVIVHEEEIQGIPVLWTGPTGSSHQSNNNDNKPCGILFVAHGCSHSNTDWFLKSSVCEDCIGLPEELAIVDIALSLHLVVVAISSKDRLSKCWNPNIDGPRVATVLQELITTRYYNTPNIPIYSFGASSGGSFVSQLSPYLQKHNMRLNGFLSQISAQPSPTNDEDCQVYITMDLDTHTDDRAKRIVGSSSSSSSENNNNNSTKKKHIRLTTIPMTDSIFSDRIKTISKSKSKIIVESLKQAKLVNNNGRWMENPRAADWRSIVSSYITNNDMMNDSLIADQSPINEVINVAYGQHELSRDGVEDGLRFCLENFSNNNQQQQHFDDQCYALL